VVGPGEGEMAERGEAGLGRMAEPLEIAAAAEALLASSPDDRTDGPLAGKRLLVTFGGPPMSRSIPVRYIANRFVRQAGPCHRGGGCTPPARR